MKKIVEITNEGLVGGRVIYLSLNMDAKIPLSHLVQYNSVQI